MITNAADTAHEQAPIDLREPVGYGLKALCSIISAMLLAFLMKCCLRLVNNSAESVGNLAVIAIVAIPSLPFLITTLYFWWGKKYLTIQGKAVVIHQELLGLKRTRCVIPGRNSRLILRSFTLNTPEHSGCGTVKLELQMTDSYGRSCRLLQFAASERERIIAIGHEICRRLPDVTLITED